MAALVSYDKRLYAQKIWNPISLISYTNDIMIMIIIIIKPTSSVSSSSSSISQSINQSIISITIAKNI